MKFKHPFYSSWNVIRIEYKFFCIVCPTGWIFALGTRAIPGHTAPTNSNNGGTDLPLPRLSAASPLVLLHATQLDLCFEAVERSRHSVLLVSKSCNNSDQGEEGIFLILLGSLAYMEKVYLKMHWHYMLLQYASKFLRGVGVKLERRKEIGLPLCPGVRWKWCLECNGNAAVQSNAEWPDMKVAVLFRGPGCWHQGARIRGIYSQKCLFNGENSLFRKYAALSAKKVSVLSRSLNCWQGSA